MSASDGDSVTAIDPEIAGFLALLGEDWRRHPPLDTLPPPEARAVAEQVRARWRAGGPAMADTRNVAVETTAGPLGLRIHRPAGLPDGPAPTLLYIHGGGFVLFSLDTHDRLMRAYAAAGGFVVAGIDYPLSPEHRYPVALDRVVALVELLHSQGAAWGIDSARLAIGGDSVGANLALATCLRLRDAGANGPRAILSNYGAFSGRVSDAAEAAHGGPDAVLTQAEMAWYFDQYLTDRAQLDDGYACPLVAADLTGLPPTLLIVPDRDVLAEQSHAVAARLERAELRIYPRATHSFLEAMSVSTLARTAIADGAAWVSQQLMKSD